MRIATAIYFLVAFAWTQVSAAEPEKGDLVKVVIRPIRTVIGVVQEVEATRLTLFDLKNQRNEDVIKSEIRDLIVSPSDQEMIPTLSPAQILGFRISNVVPRSVKSGKIAAIDGSSVYITLGASDAIQIGDEFIVYRGETEIKDPETGEVLGKQSRKIGHVAISEIKERLAKAKLIGDLEIELQVGDRVEPAVKDKPLAVMPVATEDGLIPRGGLILAEELTARLTEYEVPLVERSRLAEVLVELAIQQTALFDPESSAAFGKQVGAAYVVVGRAIPVGRLGGSLTLRVVDVATGKIAFASNLKLSSFDFTDNGDPIESVKGTAPMQSKTAAGRSLGGNGSDAIQSLKNPKDATFAGSWELSDGEIKNREDLSAIGLPIRATGTYSLAFELNRVAGSEGMFVYLPVGERGVLLGLAHGGAFAGGSNHHLTSVEGEMIRKDGSIPNNQWIPVKVETKIVGKKSNIRVSIDGKEYFDWSGDPNDLVSEKRWTPTDRKQFGLVVLRSRVSFRKFNVTGNTGNIR